MPIDEWGPSGPVPPPESDEPAERAQEQAAPAQEPPAGAEPSEPSESGERAEAGGPPDPADAAEAAEEEASGLSELDRAVLDLAARNWTGPGPRDRAVRERLGMSPTAFFQHLNALLDDPAALRHDPVTVNRWRAARARHEANR